MRVETFALFLGIAYLAAGLLGLVDLFPLSVVHAGVYIAVGAWGIAAGRSLASPRLYARCIAVLFALLVVVGAIAGLAPLLLQGPYLWLHGATAALAAYFGWHTAASVERRGGKGPDRREQAVPVDEERRARERDRRLPASEI